MNGEDARRAIDAVWRIESARLIASLARMTGDVGIAEDLAQDALIAALEQWPATGVPDNPGAWLMTTAKNRATDRLRRGERAARREEELGREVELRARLGEGDLAAAADDEIEDDLLSLIFTACHPVLSTEARVALTLRLVGSLTTAEIARAFLAKESTVAQRIVRAQRALARGPGRLARQGGERPCLSRQGVDGGAADRPRQADPGRGAGADRGARCRRARAAAGLGPGGDLRDLQRGLRGERRCGPGPRRAPR